MQWDSLPDFQCNESKSRGSIIIMYKWPTEVKVRDKSSVMAMEVRS